jgi:LPXTG-motif cell wall-anchored protein
LLAADPSLRLVSVHGFDGGTAVLRLDGMIEVMADRAGTFTYTLADTSGAVADAQVSVRLAMQVPPPSPTDPPTPTSPAPPPVTTPVVPPPGAVPAVGPATGVVPATTTPGDMKPSDVTLPETGADITLRLRLAGFSLIVGIALVIAVRRRRQPDRSL